MTTHLGSAQRSLRLLLALAAYLLYCLSPGQSLHSQELARIQTSYDGTAGFNLPIWILESTDIGRKYGFDIKTTLMSGAKSAFGLIGGSFDYSQTGMLNAITAAAQGGELVTLGTSEFGFSYKLVARKDVTEPRQLKGGMIGVAAYGGTNHLSVRLALTKLGLSERDVKIIVAGSTAQRVLSLMTLGGLDATVLSPPALFRAEKAGLPVFADIRDFGDYPNSSLVTTRDRVKTKRDEVRRFVRAWTEAIAFFKRRPKETQAILRKYLKLEDPEILRVTYEFYAEKLPRSPRISEKGVKALIDTIDAIMVYQPKIQAVAFEHVVDMSFVDEMEKDSFIANLYR